MSLIPSGQFVMGEMAGHPDEGPAAAVKISEPFWMGTLEVTNAQFARFDPSHDSRLEAYPGNNFSVPVRGELVNGQDQPVCRVDAFALHRLSLPRQGWGKFNRRSCRSRRVVE